MNTVLINSIKGFAMAHSGNTIQVGIKMSECMKMSLYEITSKIVIYHVHYSLPILVIYFDSEGY